MKIKKKIALLISGTIITIASVFLYFILSDSDIPIIGSKKHKEGIITFDITYLEEEKFGTMIDLLPRNMNEYFKENNTKIEIGMGLFNTSYISKYKDNYCTILLRIMSSKHCYNEPFTDSSIIFKKETGMKIEYTDETKRIAGYKCKKANIIFPNRKKENFSVWYTDKIKIENPNRNNPFQEIKGVLLEFQVSLLDIKMKYVASKVNHVEVPDETFNIPANFKYGTKKEIEDILNQLKYMLM